MSRRWLEMRETLAKLKLGDLGLGSDQEEMLTKLDEAVSSYEPPR